MRKARVAILLVGGLAIVALSAWMLVAHGGLPAATTATRTGLSKREALLGMLTLGVLALAAYGFDLRDWF